MGTVTSGVFSSAAATAFIPWGSWLAPFAVDHDTSTGYHTTIHANDYLFNATAGRNGNFQVSAYEMAALVIGFRQNGGAFQASTFSAAGAAEPANIRTNVAISGSFAELLVPLRFPPDQAIIINTLFVSMWTLAAAASEYITIEIIEAPVNSFVASIVIQAAWTMAKPAAATWGAVTPASGPALPYTLPAPATEDVIRYWRIRLYEPNTGNTRIAGVYGTAAAAKLSPLP